MSDPKSSVDELADALDEQRRHWRQGKRVQVESVLSTWPHLLADSSAVLDLIYNEVVLREEVGEQAQLAEYVARFPNLREELTVQFEVDQALNMELLGDAQVNTEPAYRPLFPSLPGHEILAMLGHGNTGVVYKARNLQTNQLVAVKFFLAGKMPRLREDLDKIARLKDKHIVRVHEVGIHLGRPFVVQELMSESLAQRLSAGPMEPLQAGQWLEALALAIHFAHQEGVVHGNLKPTNVLVGPTGAIMLTDFGLGEQSRSVTQRTARYLAPEQIDGSHANGPAVDIYALGAILFEMIAGQPAFQDADAGERQDRIHRQAASIPPQLNIPRELETICVCCLHHDPAQRYATAAQLADDLKAFRTSRPIRATRPSWVGRVANWFGKSEGQAKKQVSEHDDDADRRVRQLRLLLSMVGRLASTRQRDDLLALIVESAVWLMNAEHGLVFVVDPTTGTLRSGTITVSPGVGIVGAVAGTGEAIVLSDVSTDSRFTRDLDRRTDQTTRSLLAVPMRGEDGGVIAVLQVSNKRRGVFEREDCEILTELCVALASAITPLFGHDEIRIG